MSTVYFTGRPCKHGHVEGRYKCSHSCVACARESALRCHHAKSRRATKPTRPAPQLCESCGNPPTGRGRGRRVLSLDHDHVTGKFRGWLCHGCNAAIGQLGDNVPGLLRALDYLLRNE